MVRSRALRTPLRIVFYKEGDSWIAHCLEFDVMGDGPTREDAIRGLTEAIHIQVVATLEHDNPQNLFSPADGKYFEMFAAGTDIAAGLLEIVLEIKSACASIDGRVLDIEGIDAREYQDLGAELALA